MTISISESGASFGPFAEDDCYHIERSSGLASLGSHVKISEFVVRLVSNDGQDYLAIVEAKSSIPRDSDDFFANIREKLVNTFTLLMLSVVGRQPVMSGELPVRIRNFSFATSAIRLFVVIPRLPNEHLAAITDKFRQVLQVERKTWNLQYSDLWVLNEEKARQQGLIVENARKKRRRKRRSRI